MVLEADADALEVDLKGGEYDAIVVDGPLPAALDDLPLRIERRSRGAASTDSRRLVDEMPSVAI